MTTIFNNGYIANSRFPWVPKPGTGNKSCKGVTDAEKLRLVNVLIDRAGMDEFLNVLYANGEKKMDITLSPRRTTKRWGSAWYMERRVKLYRHTVWIFLHEVAHIMDVHTSLATGARVRNVKPHGLDFGRHLTQLYNLWMEFCDKGVENFSQKPTTPDLDNLNRWKVPELRPRIVGGISLQVGERVWFLSKGNKIFGKVKKVNKKTCRVTPLDGGSDWRVSPKLLKKATGDVDIPITKDEYNGLKDAMAFEPRKKQRSQADIDVLKAWKLKYRRR
jgi:hypothetical protein